MVVKKGKWTSRRRRPGKGARGKIWYAAATTAAAAAVLIWLGTASAPLQRPPGAEAAPAAPEGSVWSRLLQRMLAGSIPGMEQPGLAENEEIRGAVLHAFYSLTGLDPLDPRSILERELGAGALISLPALHPPWGQQPGGEGDDEPPPPPPEEPDTPAPVFNPRFPFLGYSEPVMMIYHTHITESFEPSFGVRYSQNMDQTVARLGDELVRTLQDQYGLPILYHRGLYDLPRALAYKKARPVIQEILAENPPLDMVIDLHRDGVPREVTTITVNGAEVGKILIVIGTRHPNWESNLAAALCLHRELEVVAPGISRGVRQQNYGYNQDLHFNSILLEVGGHENTMEEALRTIPYLAEALARTYYRLFVED